ncbi:MAG: photosynthetic reaction center cytochrome PufC [Betaproteobacteria bacterium]
MAQTRFALIAAACVLASTLLVGCERLPMDTQQVGYRGTGMEQVTNPRIVAANAPRHVAPPVLDPADAGGPRASQAYQNVKVLGHLSVGEFTRTMIAITNWVSPEQGCVYCHNPANFADDSMQTKIVSRRMVQMTQEINSTWKNHVVDTGVTCYTCHRGKNVPEYKWFADPPAPSAGRMLGNDFGQNKAGKKSVGNASLPYDPFTPYFLGKDEIRFTATTALPVNAQVPLKQAEVTHALMIHMSEGLGVGCVNCHNTRAFAEWSQSPPARVQSWYGIRMVREVNNVFMVPLTPGQPKERLGRTGDIAKVNCTTCHQGVNKPLNGAKMLTAHPELAKPAGAPVRTSALSELPLSLIKPAN